MQIQDDHHSYLLNSLAECEQRCHLSYLFGGFPNFIHFNPKYILSYVTVKFTFLYSSVFR